MISTNAKTKDLDDVGVLFHAIIRYAEGNEVQLDSSPALVGYGRLLGMAGEAAEQLANRHVDEGDDWDGVVWMELLEDIADGSLAQAIFHLALYDEQYDIGLAVQKWLDTIE